MIRAKHIRLFPCLGFFVLSLLFSFTQKQKTWQRTLNIQHRVGKQALKLDVPDYKNSLGQSFSITKFKYYIGNILLRQANGKEFRTGQYFLVNEEDEASKHMTLENIPPGNYTTLEFTIGVDSVHNCSGAQSGALDPANAMFWAWNSGYIFLKLEGVSAASQSPGHLFEYHIGGYKQPGNCIRKVTLLLGKQDLQNTTLDLEADVMRVLEGAMTIDFTKLSSVTDHHNAPLIADNYKDMFSISKKTHAD